MSFTVLSRSCRAARISSLSLVAILIMGAGAALAQDAPSNTAVGSNGAAPVLLGNNAGRMTSNTPIATGGSINVAPITIVTPRASSGESENKFKTLMDSLNGNMNANGNAASAAREKVLAAQAEARAAAYDKEHAGSDADKRDGRKPAADSDKVIMHYTEPNDSGARPAHTFSIE